MIKQREIGCNCIYSFSTFKNMHLKVCNMNIHLFTCELGTEDWFTLNITASNDLNIVLKYYSLLL